jgi:hypothetical protein
MAFTPSAIAIVRSSGRLRDDLMQCMERHRLIINDICRVSMR